MKGLEYERKYAVDHKLLPVMPQPWVFVQGYSPGKRDLSMRVIPACVSAFGRDKDIAYGVRMKDSTKVSYQKGVSTLHSYPTAVVKIRHVLRLPDRTWLIDHLPESDVWHAETEFDDADSFFEGIAEQPNWLGTELTWLDEGYTRNFAQPRTIQELDALLTYAAQTGCDDPYDPDTIFGN